MRRRELKTANSLNSQSPFSASLGTIADCRAADTGFKAAVRTSTALSSPRDKASACSASLAIVCGSSSSALSFHSQSVSGLVLAGRLRT